MVVKKLYFSQSNIDIHDFHLISVRLCGIYFRLILSDQKLQLHNEYNFRVTKVHSTPINDYVFSARQSLM